MRNYFSVCSIVLGIASFFSGRIAPLIFKTTTTSNSLLEAVSGRADLIRKSVMLQAGIGGVAVVLGIMGLLAYKKNIEVKGRTGAIVGILIGGISSGLALLISSLASNMPGF